MSTVRLEAVKPAAAEREIPMQPASQDIWDKKYRLKTKAGEAVDADIDATYQRVAKALAEAEPNSEKQAYWYERFVWALRRGAILRVAGANQQQSRPRRQGVQDRAAQGVDSSRTSELGQALCRWAGLLRLLVAPPAASNLPIKPA